MFLSMFLRMVVRMVDFDALMKRVDEKEKMTEKEKQEEWEREQKEHIKEKLVYLKQVITDYGLKLDYPNRILIITRKIEDWRNFYNILMDYGFRYIGNKELTCRKAIHSWETDWMEELRKSEQ